MHIAYISSVDPTDKLAWSGSHFSIYTALQKNFDKVTILGPYIPSMPVFLGKIKNALAGLYGKRFDYSHSESVSLAYANYFDAKLAAGKYDLIVAPAASAEIARLKTKIPIIYLSDATVAASLNYHKALSNLTASSEKESIETEKLALQKSFLNALTTPWAVDSAIEQMGIAKGKMMVLPFGANFEEVPERKNVLPKKKGEVCKLLFIGVNWKNKGGAIAVAVLKRLIKSGINAELTICGCVPPDEFKHEKIKVIPFLNKAIKAEREKLYNLYAEASFFILPTRFEAYGLVFCEASAYGLISLATKTGGIPGVITEGENGFLFDMQDEGEGYANKISELWNDTAKYNVLSESSRKVYEEKLNWDVWAKNLMQRLNEHFNQPS